MGGRNKGHELKSSLSYSVQPSSVTWQDPVSKTGKVHMLTSRGENVPLKKRSMFYTSVVKSKLFLTAIFFGNKNKRAKSDGIHL